MLNKLSQFIREQKLLDPGDRVVCAVSGGTDSVALLFALYLLKDRLDIHLEAAHLNHRLRGDESDGDEAFVRELCGRYDIPLHVGEAQVRPGTKGLEAAAREARYGFFRTLGGKTATAHTADDNAETVLLNMIRGTGLKGLGGIAPVQGNVIRPMLTVTRAEAEAFLVSWSLPHRDDSSNATDLFLRNRIRHHVMPLLTAENPRLALSLSQMALRLRLDEAYLRAQAALESPPSVTALKAMPPALRGRALEEFLKRCGVPEPQERHIAMAQSLLFSQNPSAQGQFPGGVVIGRRYDRLERLTPAPALEETVLPCPGTVRLPGLKVVCGPATELVNTPDAFTIHPTGQMRLRPRQSGDVIRLPGGSRSLKKLFIDRRIPAARRQNIPVLCDDAGIVGVYAIGVQENRAAKALPAFTVRFETIPEQSPTRDKGDTEHGKRH